MEADAPGGTRTEWDRFATGVVFVGLGVLWLLASTDVVDPNWRIILPAALIAVGFVMLLLALGGRVVDLGGTGTLLAVLVVVAAFLPANPSLRMGDQNVRPATVDDVRLRYSHGLGNLIIDLRDVDFDGDVELTASTMIGELTVRVRDDAALDIDARAGVGRVTAGDEESDGFRARVDTRVVGEGPTVRLDLSVGIGRVRVERLGEER